MKTGTLFSLPAAGLRFEIYRSVLHSNTGRFSMIRRIAIFLLFLAPVLAGCAGMEMNTVTKTKGLAPGMTYEEVVALLGEPKGSEVRGEKWILKYKLHQNWKGFVPYYMVLGSKTRRLESWYMDEEEYQKNQQMWQGILKGMAGALDDATKQGRGRTQGQGVQDESGQYMEGYDPNEDYYTDDPYYEGTPYHYDYYESE